MSAVLGLLIELNIAAGAAILFVLLVRRPAARLLGPHAAYSLWAIVPVAMLATLLPERTTETFVTEFLIGGIPASVAAARLEASASWLMPALVIGWAPPARSSTARRRCPSPTTPHWLATRSAPGSST